MIGRAVQTGMISEQRKINILITKWDKIVEAKEEEVINSFLISPLKNRFPNSLQGVLTVSARSMMKDIKAGTGLSEFLSLCTEPTPQNLEDESPISIELKREFQKFKYL